MSPFAAAVLLALTATTVFNVGMGMQKAGAAALAHGLVAWRDPALRSKLWIWILGTGATMGAVVIQAQALRFGAASVVGAINGFGLVVLTLFSALVLHEHVGPVEYGAMGAIVLGVAGVGYGGAAVAAAASGLHLGPLVVSGAVLLGPLCAVTAIAFMRGRGQGFLCGLLAGTLAGLGVVTLKAGAISHAWVWTGAIWLILTAVSFGLTQLAYQYGRAIEVVPSFSSATILLPLMVSPFAFDEVINGWMIVGITVVVGGIAALGYAQRFAEQANFHTHMDTDIT